MKKFLCLIFLILSAVCFVACNRGNDDDLNIDTAIVTLDLDGGLIDGATTYYATLWEDLIIPTPYKEGYEFKGWYYQGGYVSLAPFMIQKEKVTIIATWKERTYDVHLDCNGGYIEDKDGFTVSKKNVSATYSQNVTFPEPQKAGYEFAGWYYGEEQVSLEPWNLDVGNVILKAGWTHRSYDVTFKFNGGTLVGGDQTLIETVVNAKFNRTVEFPVLRKPGYNFVGWAFEGEEVLETNVWSYEIDAPVLHAVFEPIAVNYVFDAIGGKADFEGGNVNYGASTEEIKLVTAQKPGYEFDCWMVDGTPIGENFEYLPTANRSVVVLTARYNPKKFTLTLNAEDGELVGDKEVLVSFGVESEISMPTPPTGFKFLGWKVKTTGELVSSYNGKIVWNYPYDTELIARYSSLASVNFIHADGGVDTITINELIESGGAAIPIPNEVKGYTSNWELSDEEILALTENTQVRAVTTANSYAIAFKNGLKTINENESVFFKFGESVMLPGEDFVQKSGYTLKGWSTQKDNQVDYFTGTIVWDIPAHTALYAVWAPTAYKITYDLSSIKADYTLFDSNGNMASSVQEVTYSEEYTLHTLVARDNLISVAWLYNGQKIDKNGIWNIKSDATLTPQITYNNVQVEVNLSLNGGIGATTVKFTLGKSFKYINSVPTAPKGKKLIGYSYKGKVYALDDIFLVTDYDGSPFKCLYEDVMTFTINIDLNGGTGETTAVIEYGKKLSTMSPRPTPPSGKKLVGFSYNGTEYALSYVWEFASYDGGVFIAIYADDNVDWSPTV